MTDKMYSLNNARKYLSENGHFTINKKSFKRMLDVGRLVPEVDFCGFRRISQAQLDKYIRETAPRH